MEYLLELGDKYQINYVIDQCEKFLIRAGKIEAVQKLVWADRFKLSIVQVRSQREKRIKSVLSGHRYQEARLRAGH